MDGSRVLARCRAAGTVVVVAASLAVAACGSAPPAKTVFIDRADTICAATDKAIAKVHLPVVSGASTDQILDNYAAYVDKLIPLADSTLRQLRALSQPKADRALLRRYFTSLHSGIEQLRQLSRLARAHQSDEFRTAVSSLQTNESDQLATRYGFKVCGGSGGAG